MWYRLNRPIALYVAIGSIMQGVMPGRIPWDGVQYRTYPDGQPEVTILRYKIPAHSSLPWHTHPVINAGYVLSGHLTVIRKSDGKTIVIGPGDVLPEMVDAPHRGQSEDEPVELIVFYAGTPAVPLTVKSEPN